MTNNITFQELRDFVENDEKFLYNFLQSEVWIGFIDGKEFDIQIDQFPPDIWVISLDIDKMKDVNATELISGLKNSILLALSKRPDIKNIQISLSDTSYKKLFELLSARYSNVTIQ